MKSISYRIIGGLITMGVAYLLTGRAAASAMLGLTDTLVKIWAFYLHERIWLRIDYGRGKGPDYHI